jgi:hypothetical protein
MIRAFWRAASPGGEAAPDDARVSERLMSLLGQGGDGQKSASAAAKRDTDVPPLEPAA